MNFKFSTNFLLPYARKPAKYGGCGSTGLDATPTVQIHTGHPVCTGKSFSEALILVSTNPQYDKRLFIELQVQYVKIPSSNRSRTCCVHRLF